MDKDRIFLIGVLVGIVIMVLLVCVFNPCDADSLDQQGLLIFDPDTTEIAYCNVCGKRITPERDGTWEMCGLRALFKISAETDTAYIRSQYGCYSPYAESGDVIALCVECFFRGLGVPTPIDPDPNLHGTPECVVRADLRSRWMIPYWPIAIYEINGRPCGLSLHPPWTQWSDLDLQDCEGVAVHYRTTDDPDTVWIPVERNTVCVLHWDEMPRFVDSTVIQYRPIPLMPVYRFDAETGKFIRWDEPDDEPDAVTVWELRER